MSMLASCFVHRGSRAAAFSLLAIGLLMMAGMMRQDVQRFARLEIVRDGRPVIELNTDERGGVIRVFNLAGAETLALRIGDDGGADIRINDRIGQPALRLRTGEETLQVTMNDDDRELVVLERGQAAPAGADEGTLNSIRMLSGRLAQIDVDLRALKSEHEDLVDDIRDIRPGLDPGTTFDRLQRDLRDLRRDQMDIERDIRSLQDDEVRLRREVNDLDRRLRRLESRIP